jgi:hypothetical protein
MDLTNISILTAKYEIDLNKHSERTLSELIKVKFNIC